MYKSLAIEYFFSSCRLRWASAFAVLLLSGLLRTEKCFAQMEAQNSSVDGIVLSDDSLARQEYLASKLSSFNDLNSDPRLGFVQHAFSDQPPQPVVTSSFSDDVSTGSEMLPGQSQNSISIGERLGDSEARTAKAAELISTTNNFTPVELMPRETESIENAPIGSSPALPEEILVIDPLKYLVEKTPIGGRAVIESSQFMSPEKFRIPLQDSVLGDKPVAEAKQGVGDNPQQEESFDSSFSISSVVDPIPAVPFARLKQADVNGMFPKKVDQTLIDGDNLNYSSLTLNPSVPSSKSWVAPNFVHRPLYFEDVQLERYGNARRFQSVASGMKFFSTIPILPYKIGCDLPGECQYTLGFGRPGNCMPYDLYRRPIDYRGLLNQGLWTSAIVIP